MVIHDEDRRVSTKMFFKDGTLNFKIFCLGRPVFPSSYLVNHTPEILKTDVGFKAGGMLRVAKNPRVAVSGKVGAKGVICVRGVPGVEEDPAVSIEEITVTRFSTFRRKGGNPGIAYSITLENFFQVLEVHRQNEITRGPAIC